jgi:hypothetical protein
MGSGFEVKGGELVLRFNTSVYTLERIYATLYIFLDRYYFVLDGDKASEVVVYAQPKKGTETDEALEAFAREFFEEILSITNYFNQFEKNKEIIGMAIQRALFSVVPQQEEPMTKISKE